MGMQVLFDGAALADLRMEHVLAGGRVGISFAGRGATAATACLPEFRVARCEDDEALDEAAAQGLRQTGTTAASLRCRRAIPAPRSRAAAASAAGPKPAGCRWR